MCNLKHEMGLSFQRFKDINYALLAKLGWKMAVDKESLWTNIMKAKYLKGKTFLSAANQKELLLFVKEFLVPDNFSRHIVVLRLEMG